MTDRAAGSLHSLHALSSTVKSKNKRTKLFSSVFALYTQCVVFSTFFFNCTLFGNGRNNFGE